MLFLIRTPTRILNEPSLKAPIERAAGRGIAAAIRHDAADDDPLDRLPFQYIAQIRIDKGIIGILADDMIGFGYTLNLRKQFPVLTSRGDGALGAPFADELVPVGRGELFGGVAVLGEDEGAGGGLEVGAEAEDIREGGGGHVEEDALHVDDEQGGGHGAQKLTE
ncbi:MAG: hypothetical protein ALECFALPRED_005616 [Alectoria fallacina]|uniref:Uncharacterized protein n=1 Tax=Alectoria fallacina TaxID=1903189 RepID=A0A8H3G5Q6_9LECA|nr:MAG: hypothetical protein ALECFALPRED_005616 [Alectoria fallacina]